MKGGRPEADGSEWPPGPLGSQDGQAAYAAVLRMYALAQPPGFVAPAAAREAAGGRPRTSAARGGEAANSEASPMGADAALRGAEDADGRLLPTLWAAFDHEAGAGPGAGLLPGVGAVLRARPALAHRMVEWESRRVRATQPPDGGRPGEGRDAAGGASGDRAAPGGVGGRLARFLPYALEHGERHIRGRAAAAAGLVRAAASVALDEDSPQAWPRFVPLLRAAVRARFEGVDEGIAGARRVLLAALRRLAAGAREGDGREAEAAFRSLAAGLGDPGGRGGGHHRPAPIMEAVYLWRALPAGFRRRVLEDMDWTPAVLDVAARAAMGDAHETAALTALLRSRCPPAPAPARAHAEVESDGESGSGGGSSDRDEGSSGWTQSLLELTAAVYRRGGARGPGAASRLPALVALFVTLGAEEQNGPPRFLGANDGVAFLQAKLLAAILVEDQAAATPPAQAHQDGHKADVGEGEEDRSLAGCGPALLQALLRALVAPRGVWMRRERDVMEALGRVVQILTRATKGPPAPPLPPPPQQPKSNNSSSPTDNRRRSRRRSGGKDEEGAVSPAPGVTTTNSGGGGSALLVRDAELCAQVMAAALALCGEVQDLHRAEMAMHAPRRGAAPHSKPPHPKRRRLSPDSNNVSPPRAVAAATAAAAGALVPHKGGGAVSDEEPGKREQQQQQVVVEDSASVAAVEYEGDRKVAWMLARALDVILQVGAAGPVLAPSFLSGLLGTLDARFGGFFEGGDHYLCRPADCPFARPQRLLRFALGPLREQLRAHGFLTGEDRDSSAAPAHAWREAWSAGAALTIRSSSGGSGSHPHPGSALPVLTAASINNSLGSEPTITTTAAAVLPTLLSLGSSVDTTAELGHMPTFTSLHSGFADPPPSPGGFGAHSNTSLGGAGRRAPTYPSLPYPPKHGRQSSFSPPRTTAQQQPPPPQQQQSSLVLPVPSGPGGPRGQLSPGRQAIEAHGGIPQAVEGFLRYITTTGGATVFGGGDDGGVDVGGEVQEEEGKQHGKKQPQKKRKPEKGK